MLLKSKLVLELGLHGGNNKKYYHKVIEKLDKVDRDNVLLKLQYYTEPAGRVMPCLSKSDLIDVLAHAYAYDFRVGCTAHDEKAMEFITQHAFDFYKISHVQYKNERMVKLAQTTGKPVFISIPTTEMNYNTNPAFTYLSCCGIYPNIEEWDGRFDGFSCHAYSALIEDRVLGAFERGADVCEVHVTNLDFFKGVPPIPSDLGCSLPIKRAIKLSKLLNKGGPARAQSAN
jgi:hypothetical protein